MFIGYTESWKNYRSYDVEWGRIVVSSNVKFDEYISVPRTSSAYTEKSEFDTLIHFFNSKFAKGAGVVDTKATEDTNNNEEYWTHLAGSEEALLQEAPIEAEPNICCFGHQHQPPLRLTYKRVPTHDEDANAASMFVVQKLSNFEEATIVDDSDKWKAASHEKIKVLQDRKTKNLDAPGVVCQEVMDWYWVFKVKPATRATTKRYKARLIAKGF